MDKELSVGQMHDELLMICRRFCRTAYLRTITGVLVTAGGVISSGLRGNKMIGRIHGAVDVATEGAEVHDRQRWRACITRWRLARWRTQLPCINTCMCQYLHTRSATRLSRTWSIQQNAKKNKTAKKFIFPTANLIKKALVVVEPYCSQVVYCIIQFQV